MVEGGHALHTVPPAELHCKVREYLLRFILRIDFGQGDNQFPCFDTFALCAAPLKLLLAFPCKVTPKFIVGGAEGKCIEARELIIALPEVYTKYEPQEVLEDFTEEFRKRYGVECVSALHHNKRKTNYHIHLIFHGKEVAFVNLALFNDGAAFSYLSVLPCDFFLGAYPFACFIIEHAACGYLMSGSGSSFLSLKILRRSSTGGMV